jgi:hypothetical protein
VNVRLRFRVQYLGAWWLHYVRCIPEGGYVYSYLDHIVLGLTRWARGEGAAGPWAYVRAQWISEHRRRIVERARWRSLLRRIA